MERSTTDNIMQAIVSASNIKKSYNHTMVVKGISFSITKGKCFGFLGPNGAGKTTTLKMILGLAPLSAGDLSVFNLLVPEHARDIRKRIGVVPQNDNLDPDFSVRENLRIYGKYFGIPKKVALERIDRLLAFASLTERAKDKTEHLSGGMKRRLTIARALINEPELVVLDEPTTGLDPQARHIIWSRLNELKERGTTLILTTHYMEEAERLCDELVIMDSGQILDQGSPKELIKRNVEPEVVEIRGESSLYSTIQRTHPECRFEEMGTSLYCYTRDPAPLINTLQNSPGITFLHRPTGLEDVFLKLTGKELRD